MNSGRNAGSSTSIGILKGSLTVGWLVGHPTSQSVLYFCALIQGRPAYVETESVVTTTTAAKPKVSWKVEYS